MANMQETYPPPTPEEWDRLPWLIKAWIVVIVFASSWQSSLAFQWLKIAGADGANDA